MLAIGDAMHTDINGALAMGLDSLLITERNSPLRIAWRERRGLIDAEAYRQFIESHGVSPLWRMNRLVW